MYKNRNPANVAACCGAQAAGLRWAEVNEPDCDPDILVLNPIDRISSGASEVDIASESQPKVGVPCTPMFGRNDRPVVHVSPKNSVHFRFIFWWKSMVLGGPPWNPKVV